MSWMSVGQFGPPASVASMYTVTKLGSSNEDIRQTVCRSMVLPVPLSPHMANPLRLLSTLCVPAANAARMKHMRRQARNNAWFGAGDSKNVRCGLTDNG